MWPFQLMPRCNCWRKKDKFALRQREKKGCGEGQDNSRFALSARNLIVRQDGSCILMFHNCQLLIDCLVCSVLQALAHLCAQRALAVFDLVSILKQSHEPPNGHRFPLLSQAQRKEITKRKQRSIQTVNVFCLGQLADRDTETDS